MPMLNGLEVIINAMLTETVQYSRSPGRAARRKRRGFRQHYVTRPSKEILKLGNKLVMHPATWAFVRASIPLQSVHNYGGVNVDGRIRL